MTKKTTPNNFFAGFAVLIIIATSLSLLFLAKTNEDPNESFIRTVDNASYDCEEEIVSRYGNKLISKSFDNLSSRYQPSSYTDPYYRVARGLGQAFCRVNSNNITNVTAIHSPFRFPPIGNSFGSL